MTEEEKQLIAEAELGEEAREFLDSDLYRFMLGAAKQESQAAFDAFKSVDTADKSKVDQLQNQANFADAFEAWLNELVTKGNQALVQWKELKSDGEME